MAHDLALLVDGDQIPPDDLPALVRRLEQKWKVTARVCVRNWRSTRDQQAWRAFADEHSFRLIQRDPVATGKNAADIEVAVEAMDLLHGGCEAFCIVSGDTDFTPLVQRLRRNGCHVEWVQPNDLAPRRATKRAKPVAAPKPKRAAKAPKKTPPPTPERTDKQNQLARHIRRAIDALQKEGSHEQGWVSVSRLGSHLSQGGHRREDFDFARSRPMHRVLEDLGFKVQQTETGAYQAKLA